MMSRSVIYDESKKSHTGGKSDSWGVIYGRKANKNGIIKEKKVGYIKEISSTRE